MPSPGGSTGGGSSGGAGIPSPSGGSGGSDMGIPAPGGSGGVGGPDIGGAGAQSGGDSSAGGDGDGDGDSSGDCGSAGGIPGGVGGMGQDGDCLGGGGAAGSSADGAAGMGGAGGSVGEFPGESDAERAERLGQVLDESLGDFDEVLHEEQEEVAAVGRNTEGFGGGGGGSGGVSLGEQAGSGGSVAVVNEGAVRPESPTASMSEDEIRERTPEDVPMAADDDIIARQLREAALAEEDAELRERLWEEYRKYKGL